MRVQNDQGESTNFLTLALSDFEMEPYNWVELVIFKVRVLPGEYIVRRDQKYA